jgi:quinol-cytochrome oxidoreductase complex cytochrome b subunit
MTGSEVTGSDGVGSGSAGSTTSTPVAIGRLDPVPPAIGSRRVLGVVPGKPVAGERKEPADDEMVMVWPHLLVRHAVVALSTTLVVLIISVLFDAPLRDHANPTVTPNPEKAPWYFAALQELLSLFHPLIAGVLVPGAILLGLVSLPYIDRSPYVRTQHRRVAVATFTTFLVIWIALTIIGFAFRGPNWSWVWPWQEWHGEL